MRYSSICNYFMIILVFSQCSPGKKDSEENANEEYQTIGSIERIDSSLDEVLKKDAKIEILAEGFTWSEGPVWVPSINSLLYSDVPENTIYKWNESEGNSVYLKPSGHTGIEPASSSGGSNGLILDHNGDLLLCQHGDRRIARISSSQLNDDSPEFASVVNRFEDKRFNSPNDLIISSSGDIYFTDPPYGLKDQDADSLKELDYNGVYKLASDGTLTLLIDSLTRPNGIALSPDERTLYVANSDPEKAIWVAYGVTPSGIDNGRLFFDATEKVSSLNGLPDGLKVNKEGIVFATGPGGVYIFKPDGTQIGIILTEFATANCAFNENETVLYMTTHKYLTRIRLQ
ncbi:SMP-30/gluconolactonase/LRE family protein [Ekhidna sp.]